ncbi:hypothetical protein C8R47DRAFT_1230829 [Mycena vitilis]|nr:hypothetical protein C8R47DRAFT_1230829 [Mycena vitilis]
MWTLIPSLGLLRSQAQQRPLSNGFERQRASQTALAARLPRAAAGAAPPTTLRGELKQIEHGLKVEVYTASCICPHTRTVFAQASSSSCCAIQRCGP